MAYPDTGAGELAQTFDLLHLFDRIVLPRDILRHLDVHARRLLRTTCRRMRDEVDSVTTSLTINRQASPNFPELQRHVNWIRFSAYGYRERQGLHAT